MAEWSFAEFCGWLAPGATRFTDAWTTFAITEELGIHAGPVVLHPSDRRGRAHLEPGRGLRQDHAKGVRSAAAAGRRGRREPFFAAIRGCARVWNAELRTCCGGGGASSGTSLADWSKAWLETAGPNTLRCAFEVGADGAFTSFAVLQEAPPQHPTLRPHHLAVGLYARRGGELVLVRREEIDIAGPRTEVPQLAGVTQPDLIVLNDGDLDYAIIRFDQRSIKSLTEAIGTVTDPLARAVCWNAAIDMVRQAELPWPTFVRMVAGGIGQEPVPVLQALSSVTEQMMTLTGDRGWRRAAELAACRLLRRGAARPSARWAQLWLA